MDKHGWGSGKTRRFLTLERRGKIGALPIHCRWHFQLSLKLNFQQFLPRRRYEGGFPPRKKKSKIKDGDPEQHNGREEYKVPAQWATKG